MLSVHAALTVLAASSGSSKTTTTSSNPLESLLPLILIFGVAYVFFLRPRSQQARRQRETLMELSAGDEVLTGAGIFGTVLDVEPDRVTLETAPGTRITVLRSTIARKVTDPAVETPSWDEHDEDEAHGAYQEYEHDEHDEHDGDADHDGDEDHDGDDVDTEHDEHDEHDEPAVDESAAGDTDHDTEHDDTEHDTDTAHDDAPEPDGAGGKKKP
jgi:preprotein translocase subunit YajC